jgi:L-amino acid N-acyltransferase YncA
VTTTINIASEKDAKQIADIYAPCVRDTFISFETEPPTTLLMSQRILTTTQKYPWLVTRRGETVLAYAYASQHRDRNAYPWSVDVGIYVLASERRTGLGRRLYEGLFQILRLQGFYNAYAGIALPNLASVKLHESHGFQALGVYKCVGFKLGAWRDVGWWHLPLKKPSADPNTPTWFRDFRQQLGDGDLGANLPLVNPET